MSCRVARIGQNANEAALCQSARRPSVLVIVREPVVRNLVMNVIGLEKERRVS